MITRLALVLSLGVIGACATTPDAAFYTLGGDVPPAGEAVSALTLAVGPVDLPQYLDRPQIVTRDGDSRLRVDEFNRWGGSLDEEIQRVLAARLGRLLRTQRVYAYPSRIVAETDYRIALEIRRFDGPLEGTVQLDAAWSLIEDRSADVVQVRRVHLSAPVQGEGYTAYAKAMNGLLAQLADEVAAAIGQAEKNPPESGG